MTEIVIEVKCPVVEVKHVRVFGLKTELSNLDAIGKAYGVDPRFLLKYIGFQREAHTEIDHGHYRVTGTLTREQVQTHLQDFVRLHLTCANCTNNACRWQVTKTHLLVICDSCGPDKAIRRNDSLAKYVVKWKSL